MKKFNIYELIFLISSNFILIILSIVFKSSFINCIISMCGVTYVFLIGKKKKYAYYFGILNVLLYGIILFFKELYGGALYNICYGFPMLIYGYYYWSKKIDDNKINTFNKQQQLLINLLYIGIIMISLLIFLIFNNIMYILDFITTILGIVGIYLLSKKYKEQWPIWIVCNFMNFVLWIILSIKSLSNIPVCAMWALYFINSIYGYYMWKKEEI